jgi:hypothetical protein
VRVPLRLLMGLPCPLREEKCACRGIAVGAAVAAATARGSRSSRVEPGLALELAVAWPHWQAAAQAHDILQCICVIGLELDHSRPSGPAPEHLPPLCTPAATAAAHSGARRIASLNLSYFFVQVPLPLLMHMGLPCLRSEEKCACHGIAVGAAVAAATSRGSRSSRVEPGLELALQ